MMGLCVRSSCLNFMRHQVANPNRKDIVDCLTILLVLKRTCKQMVSALVFPDGDGVLDSGLRGIHSPFPSCHRRENHALGFRRP